MGLILNVDDYGPGRYARTRLLRQAGFDVREASSGKEALQIITEYSPSIVLLDVNLPDMSGFDVCRQVKVDPKTFATTVVHISATNIKVHDQVEGLDCGADCYLVEPVDPAVLIATVRAFIRARRAEDALRRSNEELERFGYRVAHDLSEPLRTMIAHTQLLERELGRDLPGNSAKSLDFVIEAAKRMRLLVDGLLSYAQVTHTSTQTEVVDCELLLAQIIANLGAMITAHDASITHDPLPQVIGDPSLEQVFQNLITNGIKYGREGIPPEIHISAKKSENEWVFSVRDNGVGIEEAQTHNVFQVFHRLHGREIPGNGIGLAVSKKIIEAHGGSIWVESQPGSGSTFYFTLPFKSAAQSSDLSLESSAADSQQWPLRSGFPQV